MKTKSKHMLLIKSNKNKCLYRKLAISNHKRYNNNNPEFNN